MNVSDNALLSGTASTRLDIGYTKFRKRLLAFLKSKVSDPAIAEDLLHEVFVKALDALNRGTRPRNLPAWLHTIAANALSDHYRRNRPTQALPDELPESSSESGTAEKEMAECMRPFIEGLPQKYREVMRATVLEGKSGAEFSRELGLSPSAIKSRAARGRSMLREAILGCCHIEATASGEITEYHRRESMD